MEDADFKALADKYSKIRPSDGNDRFLREVCRRRFAIGVDGVGWKENKVKDIATLLGTHEMQVHRWIEQAKAAGLIQLQIVEPKVSNLDALQARYPLLGKLYEIDSQNDFEKLSDALGKRTAEVFEEICLEKGTVSVSIGGGRVAYALVDSLESKSRSISVTPTTLMTRSLRGSIFDSLYLSIIAHWKSLGLSRASICACPPFPSGEMNDDKRIQYFKTLADIVWRNSEAEDWLKKSMNAEVIFLGISGVGEIAGEPYQSTTWDFYKSLGIEVEKLKGKSRVVGHCNYSLLAENGEDLNDEVWELIRFKNEIAEMPKGSHPLVPAVSIGRYKQMVKNGSEFVLTAAWDHNLKAIHAALRGGFVTRLVTDRRTVQGLLSMITV